MRRRRIGGRGGRYFEDLSPEEQVNYVIENWVDQIWTPFDAEIYDGISIDFLEYMDYYFIPNILEEIKGTKYEKYSGEIERGYASIREY